MPNVSTSTDQPREKAGARVVGWLLLALVAFFGGLYVTAHYVAGDKVPRGTTVSGVDIGGHPQAEAADRLRAGLAERVSRPIEVTIDGTPVTVEPAQAGLSVDYAASVSEAGGERSWDPVRLWNYFTGGEELEAEVEADDATFAAFVASLDEQHGNPAVDGGVAFDGTDIAVTEPQVGQELEPSATFAALSQAFVAEEDQPVALELSDVQPEIDDADVQEAVSGFASPAVAAPVVLAFQDSEVKIFPKDYLAALSLQPSGGELQPTLDTEVLAEVVGERVTTGAPVDATVALVDGRPQVIKAKPGVTYDQAQLDGAFLELVAQPQGQRTLELEAEVAKPDVTTKEARALSIKEKVSSFTTYYPHAEYRNVNIGRAAELVDGTVLEPGEIFSMNDIVGERTRANGFTEGFIISNGVFKEDLGGGVSQMATTLFNGMFFAGLKDVEHRPHSFYIDRYPVGREATVVWGALDLRFQNDTEHGVLVEAKVTPSTPSSSGVVTVSMWSTKVWDITSSTSDRYNLTQPETRILRTEDCYPNEGYGGFDIDVTRTFRRPGSSEVVKTETFTTTYTPSDTVICRPPENSTDG